MKGESAHVLKLYPMLGQVKKLFHNRVERLDAGREYNARVQMVPQAKIPTHHNINRSLKVLTGSF